MSPTQISVWHSNSRVFIGQQNSPASHEWLNVCLNLFVHHLLFCALLFFLLLFLSVSLLTPEEDFFLVEIARVLLFSCVSSHWWVHFPRSVSFDQPHQQLFTHSSITKDKQNAVQAAVITKDKQNAVQAAVITEDKQSGSRHSNRGIIGSHHCWVTLTTAVAGWWWYFWRRWWGTGESEGRTMRQPTFHRAW